MENETLVKIPSLCVGCSQGFISKMSNIFDELEKGNNRFIIFDLDLNQFLVADSFSIYKTHN